MAAPRVDRKLAAIMALDVVGYSRLIGADEAGTLVRVKAHRVELVEPLIAEHRGRVVKLTGDGALVEFGSAVDAVECAVAIQAGIAGREVAEPEERRIRYRIGINIGDIVLEDGDIFGDGVNVAARLEGLAEPGGICIARNVRNQVKGKLDLDFELMGDHRVKNIAEPITVYRVRPGPGGATKRRSFGFIGAARALAGGNRGRGPSVACRRCRGAWYALWQPASEPTAPPAPVTEIAGDAAQAKPELPLPDKPSIAVLPFDNLSGEERYGRLADGITEDIIADLSRFRQLFVIARNSTFFYKGKPTDVRQIARELGVRYVLEGSLQAENDRVRITAQLIDATTGNHVWSDQYERPIDDTFVIQDEVTELIAGQLGGLEGAIDRAGREVARRKPSENLRAYDYYLLGIATKELFTKDNKEKAQDLFQKALELDPNYALAYVGLGWTYEHEVFFGWGKSRQRSLDNMRAMAEKAIALDPYISEARLVLGMYYQYLNDFERSVAEFDKALELNPNDADGHAMANEALLRAGQPERALQLIERGMRLNPHHPEWYYSSVALAYFYNRRFEDAVAATKKVVDPAPQWDPPG